MAVLISYGSDYDPEEEKIIQVSEGKDKIEITTQREKPMKEVFIYTLMRKGEEWFLDTKKRYSTWKQKWVRESL